jgi:hypothetical protein
MGRNRWPTSRPTSAGLLARLPQEWFPPRAQMIRTDGHILGVRGDTPGDRQSEYAAFGPWKTQPFPRLSFQVRLDFYINQLLN